MTDNPQEQRDSGGGSILTAHGVVSSAFKWFMASVGAVIATGSWIAANNLYQLNISIGRLADNRIVVEKQLVDHESRLRSVERDISAIEGKVFRSGFDPMKEPVRE